MHLDILFKNILFLRQEKIDLMLMDYRMQKMQKQREAEEQLMLQNQMRKLRGRSGQKKEKSKDEGSVEFQTHTPVKEKKAYLNCMNTAMVQDESVRKMFYSEQKAQNLSISHSTKATKDSNMMGSQFKIEANTPNGPTVSPFEANCSEAVINHKGSKQTTVQSNESSVSSSVSVKSKKSGKVVKKHFSARLKLMLKKIRKQ